LVKLLIGLFILTYLGSSCTKESFISDTNAKLTFSLDTLSFDTVFTAKGSATQSFKIYNTHKQFIRISRIWLEEGSFFRMNVDGIPGMSVENVEIPPEDSIYVFVEVTVDPDQPISVSPFVVLERIQMETNGNRQEVQLKAWGQNANYVPRFNGRGERRLITCDMNEWRWDDPKPYVIFGALFIDSCDLVIPAGTKIYIHGGIAKNDDGSFYGDGILYMLKDGRLRIEGTAEEPVEIQGDRLESEFEFVPGQWGRIQLGPQSKGHSIDHAIIRNGTIGLLVDSLAEVTISNTEISNTTSSALAGYKATVRAENCLFHTSGANNVTIILGGNYNFSYCTLANFGTPSEALSAANFTCLDATPLCERPKVARLRMHFKNSIITGSSRDEIALIDAVGDNDPSFFQYSFENCIVKVDELLTEGGYSDFFSHCDPCTNEDGSGNLFLNPDIFDFHLDTLSIAEKQATPIPAIPFDLENNLRDPIEPDIGCYEYFN
jgi:hypothetical protein